MSTEINVNRVSQTPHFEAEGQALEALAKAAPLVEAVLENPGIREALLNKGIEPTVDEQPVYDILTGETQSREKFNAKAEKRLQTPKMVETRITHIDEAIEAPDDNIGNVAHPQIGIPAIEEIETGDGRIFQVPNKEYLSIVMERLDNKIFRQQVIAAFRHLGLDVRKHFGV